MNFEIESDIVKSQCQPKQYQKMSKLYITLTILTIIELAVYKIQQLTYEKFIPIYATDQNLNINNLETSWKCSLYYLGANVTPPIQYNYQLWRLFTSFFLHQNLAHLLMNSFLRFVFGISSINYLKITNFNKLLYLYLFGGLFGNLLSSFTNPTDLSIGSSSSIFSLVGANLISIMYFKYMFRKSFKLSKNLLNLFLIVFVLLTTFIGNNDIFGHLGGFFSGMVLTLNQLFEIYGDSCKHWISYYDQDNQDFCIEHYDCNCNNSETKSMNRYIAQIQNYFVWILVFVGLVCLGCKFVTSSKEMELLALVDMGCMQS